MKILVIGSSGTIGSAVSEHFSEAGHEVFGANRSSGDFRVDIDEVASIRSLFSDVGEVDAVVCAAGNGAFGPLDELGDDDFKKTIQSKLMGQVNLVRFGHEHARNFVLTSGILSQKPWPGSSALAMVNGGLESFVRAAALDLGDHRITIVSPPLVRETAVAMGMGEQGPPAAEVARCYEDALTADSGTILKVE